jgi:diadenylate cyclase
LPLLSFHWQQILDIFIVAVLFYYVFYFIRGTKTAIVIQGIIIVAIFYYVCQLLHLLTLVWIFEKVIFVGSLALIVIFTPEIRQFLERAGKARLLFRMFRNRSFDNATQDIIDKVLTAMKAMSERRMGGLIAILKDDKSALEHMVLGVKLDAEFTTELVLTIFEANTPLHDGAIVIDDGRIQYAGCFFPLSERDQAIKSLGTRHHAAIGLTERTDVIVAVVSEETGAMSVCNNGRISYNLTLEQLEPLIKLLYAEGGSSATVLPRLMVQ